MVASNTHLTRIGHNHYDFGMKRVASGILPLIAVNRDASTALHRQIYDAYRTAIVDGSLRPGQRVPSTRVLALEIGVSRFPVVNAYAQLLAEGYFESRVGAGTVISNSLPEQFPPRQRSREQFSTSRRGPRPVSHGSSVLPRFKVDPWQRRLGAFGVGQVAFDQFPLHIWANLVGRRCRKMDTKSCHYGDQLGVENLREGIANYLRTARSLNCDAKQIMVVSGSQQALEITARVLLDPGDRMWIEEPSYRLARSVFALAGCRLIPVPVDEEGLVVAAGIKLCHNARAAFVTPSHQFPLGFCMSASRRFQLLEWAQQEGAWIIEDDYDSEYRYDSLPIASLQGLDANGRVIYIGTFSKVLYPSLRLGYIVIPPDLLDRFMSVRHTMDICPPDFYPEVIADFMSEGHFARHIRRMRILYCDRRTVLVDSIRKELGQQLEVLGGEAGMHLAVALRDGRRDMEIAERAARQNLWLWPLSPCYAGKVSRSGFTLGFGGVAIEEIPLAVRRLRSLLTAK
jgi:GntR family transcriptional regulator/MocR family aminotransferase